RRASGPREVVAAKHACHAFGAHFVPNTPSMEHIKGTSVFRGASSLYFRTKAALRGATRFASLRAPTGPDACNVPSPRRPYWRPCRVGFGLGSVLQPGAHAGLPPTPALWNAALPAYSSSASLCV